MNESVWTIIGVGVGLATLIISLFKNSEEKNYQRFILLEVMFKNSEEKNAERFKQIDLKFDFLENKLDGSTQDLKEALNKVENKLNAIDGRVVEVERHLFALRTLMHYDVDIDKPKKLKEVN